MATYSRYCFSIWFVFISFCVIGQEFNNDYNFGHFSLENGLSSKQVNQIAQDSLGYLWLATNNGLSRFDGQDFTTYYGHDFGPGLSSNVTAVEVVSDKEIWIIIDSKTLLSFNIISNHFYDIFQGLDSTIQSIKENLTRIKSIDDLTYVIGDVTFVFKEQQLYKTIVFHKSTHDLVILPNNTILLAGFDLCYGFLLQMESKTHYSFHTDTCQTQGIPSNDLLMDQAGVIWSAPWENAIHRLDENYNIETIQLAPSINSNATEVNTLALDSKASIWVGTNNNGLHKYDKTHKPQKVNSNSGPSSNCHITHLFYDNNERLWIGTKSEGLYLLDPFMNNANNYHLSEKIEVLDIYKLNRVSSNSRK